jgi:Putative beta-barrel porin-2, OmpL-like. bbp2
LRIRSLCICTFLTAVFTATSAFGQASPPWSAGPIDFSALVDGYYSFNFNHPITANNDLYNFDTKTNQFSLNMAKVTLSHSADPVGFQLDLGFGQAFDAVNGTEPLLGTKNIEQAFLSYKPNKDKGLQFDFGKFVTSAGAEVIETPLNWNYSRSILFAWAIPYYHFGLRVTDTWGHFTGGFQVVNGWNNVQDNNSGKTIGLTGNFSSSKISWANSYYTGPENTGTNKGWRNLYDTVVTLTPSGKFNAYVNFDYGNQKAIISGDPSASWYGIAGAAKIQMTDKSAITPRIEYFNDDDGFDGFGQALKEFTFTYEYKWMQGLLTRLEYRHDWSEFPLFTRGNGGAIDHQDTLTIGFVAFVGPK